MTELHLSAATIAAYVDGALDAGPRTSADRHLAECATCRGELVALADLIVDLPSARRKRPSRVVVGTLAAAGILGVLLVSPQQAPGPRAAVERAARPASATIEIVEPAASGTTDPARGASIVWRSVEPRATYRVTVTDTTGATRWTGETSDTAVVLPSSARLDGGARYYIYVDALRADGWSLQSGPRAFSTTP